MALHWTRCLLILTLVALWPLAGCQRYHEKPLSSDAVEQQLSAPDESALQNRIKALQHPILHPIQINFRDGLSPEEASVIAVVANPMLRAERDQRRISEAELIQANLLPNPQFVGGLDFPYNSSPPDNFMAYNAGFEWEVTSLITHHQKQHAARAALGAANLDIAWKEWQVAQEAKTAAWAVNALELQLQSAQQAFQQLAQSAKLLERAVEQHNRTVVDLTAAQASAQDAQQSVFTQQHELEHERMVLKRDLGIASNRDVHLSATTLPTYLDPPPATELLNHLEEHRLDLRALKSGYESEDATLRAAILAQFPKITLGFSNAQDTSNVHTFGLGVTIDIPIFDRNQGAIATETATRQKLFDEYVDRVFAARSDIATASADIHATNDQIVAARQAIPALAKLVETYSQALNQGNIDALSLYTAQSTLAQKRIDLIKLQEQLVENWIALEIACGRYLPMTTAATAPTTRGSQR